MDGDARVALKAGSRRGTRTRRLPDEIAAALSSQIRSAELQPGDILPSEKQLCLRFGVSRTVVREAISRLKSDGPVRSQQARASSWRG